MSSCVTPPPISYMVVSFMSLPADAQLDALSVDIPLYRGKQNGPLGVLMNVVGYSMPFFFDHFKANGAQELLDKLKDINQRLAGSNKDSLDDFLMGAEWAELRQIAREMLSAAGVQACDFPRPLPLDEWKIEF